MSELADLVHLSLAEPTREAFEHRVRVQAAFLREALRSGELANESFAVGLELEAYATDDAGRLARLPETVFDGETLTKELGLHNAELNTEPSVFDADGVEAQAEAIHERVAAATGRVADADRRLVLDAMWTVPPPEGSLPYLSAVREEDGVTVAANMRENARYAAIDNAILRRSGGRASLDVPGAALAFPTILGESLATSIQPHLQIPDPETFPTHYNAAIRTLGPVLALSTNSPFLPADLYGDVEDAHALVEETHHELRIAVFEQFINGANDPGKVRFPGDIERTEDVIDRLLADRTTAPFLREWVDDGDPTAYTDQFWELDHKRGTYWRWLRAVIGGDPIDAGNDEHSIRIEYRPLPTQPSAADTVGFLCLTVGLIRGLVVADHPLETLDWTDAKRSFYSAAESGLDADLAWVTADGERTADHDRIYGEVFDLARRGLREAGLDDARIDAHLAPIERRWERRRTPSDWKKARVGTHLDGGASLDDAIHEMQAEYLTQSGRGEPFSTWG